MISKHNREPNRPNLNFDTYKILLFLFFYFIGPIKVPTAHIMNKLFSRLEI